MKRVNAPTRENNYDKYETPDFVFDYFDKTEKLNFVFDLAAEDNTAKCDSYFTEKDDALVQPWHKIIGNLWLNPPYKNLNDWIKKAQYEAKLGANVFMLMPAFPCKKQMAEHTPSFIWFIVGRVNFLKDKKPTTSAFFDSALYLFDDVRSKIAPNKFMAYCEFVRLNEIKRKGGG